MLTQFERSPHAHFLKEREREGKDKNYHKSLRKLKLELDELKSILSGFKSLRDKVYTRWKGRQQLVGERVDLLKVGSPL